MISDVIKMMCAVVALFGWTALAADTWYVRAGATGGDGSKASPFGVIQDAVDRAAGGDTVYVAEGVYSTGGDNRSGIMSRVSIVRKPGLKLVGAGREKSIITGSFDPESFEVFDESSDITRCVYVEASSDAIIEGFTLRDGACESTNDSVTRANSGAGLRADSADVYLVDCDVVHCSGRFGASVYNGTLVRCLVDGCYGASGPGGRYATMINSVVTRSKISGTSTAAIYECKLYNCTVVDNVATWAVQTSNDEVYNSVLMLSGNSLMYRETNKVCRVENSVLANDAPHQYRQLIAPAVGDWRPLANSDAIGTADAKWLSELVLPAGIDAFKDFSGKTIVPDAGRINAGALQEAIAPAGGAILITGGSLAVNGYAFRRSNSYLYVTNFPTQVLARCANANLFRVKRLDETGKFDASTLPPLYPHLDGRIYLMPSPNTTHIIEHQVETASKILWVDAEKGSDDNTGDSETTAFKTLSKAASVVTSSTTLVRVKRGTYDEGSTNLYGNARLGISLKNVKFLAEDGPENTFIVGEPDPDTIHDEAYPGCGPKAVKLLSLYGSGIAVQGFTLASGYTEKPSVGSLASRDSIYCNYSPMIVDCVISNNLPSRYVVNNAIMVRCKVSDNTCAVGSSIFYSGILSSVFATRNVNPTSDASTIGWCSGASRCFNTTFVGEPRTGRVGGGASFWNAIIDGGLHIYSSTIATNGIVYNVGNSTYGKLTDVSLEDPLFSDRGITGDVITHSPAIGQCAAPTAENYGSYYWRFASSDVDGNPLHISSNGRLTAGAVQTFTPSVAVALDGFRGGVETVGGESGTVYLYGDRTLGFVPVNSGTRPCAGVSANGTNLAFTNDVGNVITVGLNDLSEYGDDVTITPWYTTDWYVDAVNGDNANSGMIPTLAKKTLVVGMNLCASGDTLWALPGTYSDGSALAGSKHKVSNRVVVKPGVTLCSTDGAETTFIVGEPAKTDPDEFGRGIDATRCVALDYTAGKTTKIRGFTLTGGRTHSATTDAGVDLDGHGAAVMSLASTTGRDPSKGVFVEDCVISNCASYYGAVSRAVAVRCRVTDNNTLKALLYQGSAIGSYVDHNVVQSVFSYSLDIIGCTIGPDNLTSAGAKTKLLEAMIGGDNALFANSLFCIPGAPGGSAVTTIRNCVFAKGSDLSKNSNTNATVKIATDAAGVSIDENGAPVIGSCLAVDAGSLDWTGVASFNCLDAVNDLSGGQRIYNGTIDVGCFEADWRGRYAAALGRRVGVVVASPSVTLDANGNLTMPSGVVEAELYGVAGCDLKRIAEAAVSGAGSLSVSANDESLGEITAADGRKRMTFNSDLAVNRVRFEFDPVEGEDGATTIYSLRSLSGIYLMIR